MMKDVFQGVMLLLSMMSLAMIAEADSLNESLEAHFNVSSDEVYLGAETVDKADVDAYGSYRYLVMDFKATEERVASIQHQVHSICTKVLSDLGLVKELSNQGYDMISVSFDRTSQFDCL